MLTIEESILIYIGPPILSRGLFQYGSFVGDIPEFLEPLMQVEEIRELVVDVNNLVEAKKEMSIIGTEKNKAFQYLSNPNNIEAELSKLNGYKSFLGKGIYIEGENGELSLVGKNNPLPVAGLSGGGGGSVTVDSITDASDIGKTVLKAADASAARTAIGAGTSNLKVGSGAGDAKAGNYAPAVADISGATALGKQLMAVADAAAARSAIGAGTPVSAATTTANGTVKQAAAQANSAATDVAGLVADFNSLLGKLRTAGIIAP
ncbi:head fiber protein [Paenibacillus sp. FSL P2-0173]|uniref:head fiber protein n=1 Tax=Paenibacillus sp. FSL P2-0173 TaxID=2921627 RepID=UPI0030F59B7D